MPLIRPRIILNVHVHVYCTCNYCRSAMMTIMKMLRLLLTASAYGCIVQVVQEMKSKQVSRKAQYQYSTCVCIIGLVHRCMASFHHLKPIAYYTLYTYLNTKCNTKNITVHTFQKCTCISTVRFPCLCALRIHFSYARPGDLLLIYPLAMPSSHELPSSHAL